MYFFIGCMTQTSPESVYVCTLNEQNGSLQIINAINGMPKTAYLVPDPKNLILYAVGTDAAQKGAAVSYLFDPPTGSLTLLAQRSTLGANPNYASRNNSESLLFAVNFAGSSACVLPLGGGGHIEEEAVYQLIRYDDQSDATDKQSHPHSIVPDPANKYVIVSDMGTDILHIYKLEPKQQPPLQEHSRTFTVPKSGPRHLLFHPAKPYAYVIHEINNTIGVFFYDAAAGTLRSAQTVPSLPSDFEGISKCADLQLSPYGMYLYGTNRGHDSIVVYRVGEDGMLTYVEHVSSLGKKSAQYRYFA